VDGSALFSPASANQSPAEITVKAAVIGVGGFETGRIDRAQTVDGNNREMISMDERPQGVGR
jgi:hypothetical protein